MRSCLPFLLLLTAADGDCSSGVATSTLETSTSTDQIGPGPGHEMPVLATYQIGLCGDADSDGLVYFDLDPGTRIGLTVQLCDGQPTDGTCDDISHVCCRPTTDYSEGYQAWPAELTESDSIVNTQVLMVACGATDDYVRLTYLVAQGDPGQYSVGAQ